jgi:hypothetical protein
MIVLILFFQLKNISPLTIKGNIAVRCLKRPKRGLKAKKQKTKKKIIFL